MSTIQTSIVMADNITATLFNITNALNMTVSAFQDVQNTASNDVDATAFDAIREQINAATIATQQFESELDNIKPKTVPVDVKPNWNIQSNIEIFQNTGIERLTSEMNSLDDIINEVSKSQQRIGEQALSMDILPPNASWDINTTNQRVDELVQKLNNFQSQDITFVGADGIEQINSEYEAMRQSMNSIVNIQEQMNQAMDNNDVSKLNAGYTQLNNIAEQMERRIRDNIAAIQEMNNVQWTSPQNIEIFQGNGVERYKQEIQSANDLMNRLAATQQNISQQAANTSLFPANMVNDINGMNSRIGQLREQLEKVNQQHIDDIGAGRANAEVEALRQQLNQALEVQEELNSAMNNMDVSAANAAYNRLNSIVDSTERNIRDNIAAQDRFNNEIKDGASGMDDLKNKLLGMAAAYMTLQAGQKVLDLSDVAAQTNARLSLIVDDGGSVDALQDKIFLSAQRARADFSAVSDNIAKLGLMAGNAFTSNDELIYFAEQMNKQFTIGGSSIQESSNAMYQLTQAMAAGRLQGDEFRSIMENAPLLAQSIADSMGKTTGELREMSSEGLITADVIKNALFSAADETNRRFEEMPQTFAQVATGIKNNAFMAFQPVFERLSAMANSPEFQVFANNVINSLVIVAGVVMEIFNLIMSVGSFISDNWSLIAPIIIGAATALGIYVAVLTVYNTIQAITNGLKAIAAFRETVQAAATMMATGATFAQTAAQHGLNAALLACPLTWIIIAIIALIALVYLVVAAVNKFAGTSVSATGIIFGAFAVLGAFLWNLFLGLLDLVFGIINAMVNPFIRIANFIGNVFTSPISSIIYLFQSMADGVLAILQKIASALDFVFGSNMADTVAGWRSGLKDMADAAVAEYAPNENYQNVMDELNLSVDSVGLKRWEYGDAWETGYTAGENLEESISNFDPASLFDNNIPDAGDYANTFDPSTMAGNVGNIDDNTKEALTISEEDLKYMRDMAERETINRFTTAELTVHFDSKNEIKSDMDLDGVVSYLEEKVTETLEAVAEGVHE